MRVKVAKATTALLALRWGVMVLALMAMFVLDWSGVAFALIMIGLGLSMALRFAGARRWIASKLTNGKSDQIPK